MNDDSAEWMAQLKASGQLWPAGYRDGGVEAHYNTEKALWRHGFLVRDTELDVWRLSDAGLAVAKWMVR